MVNWRKNATKIYKAIINNTNIHLSTDQTIRNIILKIRQCIAHYIRDKYELEILAEENKNRTIAIEESLFTHINNRQVLVIGLIDTQSKDFRLVSSFTRDASKLKKILRKFVKSGNTIISDSWPGYNWISEPISGYTHIIYNHGQGQFGFGNLSTSHIEQLWSVLKGLFKSIYISIPCEYFNLFLREIEWRYTISKKNDIQKITDLCEIFDYISNTTNFNLYDLNSFDVV